MMIRAWRRKKFNRAGPKALAGLLALAMLAACGGAAQATPTPPPPLETTPAVAAVPVTPAVTLQPPTLAPTATRFQLPSATPTRTPVPVELQPSATPACENNLRYLEDLTVPDGAMVPAGTVFDKRWRVENNGSCNWTERYRWKRISGASLGLPDEQALYPARAGAAAVIRMLLTAPAEPGAYRSAWQAFDPDGQAFGDPIFVDIIVNP